MEPRDLLETVAQTYAILTSLSVDIHVINESGDADNLSCNEHRAKAFFVAPDKVRLETGRRHRGLTVSNGTDAYHQFGRGDRYTKNAVRPGHVIGSFQPGRPLFSETLFLFSRIATRVADVEALRVETSSEGSAEPCQLLSIKYEPLEHPGFASSPPLKLWVNPRTNLISRLHSETTHRLRRDEMNTVKLTLEFSNYVVNQPIPAETFEFIPPEGAVEMTPPPPQSGRGGTGVVGGIVGGRVGAVPGWHFRHEPDRKHRLQSRHSNGWDGDTLIEYSQLGVHGVDLSIERRISISDDRTQMRIVERITGPKGQTEHEITLPLA